MSLINQMLKDLEERGGLNKDSVFKPAQADVEVNQSIDDHDDDIRINQTEKKSFKRLFGQHKFVLISTLLIILYMGVYFWVKNPQMHSNHQPTNSLVNVQNPLLSSQAHVQDVDGNSIKQNSDAIVAEISREIAAQIKAQDGEVDEAHITQMVAEAKNSSPQTQETVIQDEPTPSENADKSPIIDQIDHSALHEEQSSQAIIKTDNNSNESIAKKAEPKTPATQANSPELKTAIATTPQKVQTPVKEVHLAVKAQTAKPQVIAEETLNPTRKETVKPEQVNPELAKAEVTKPEATKPEEAPTKTIVATTESKKVAQSNHQSSKKVETIAHAQVQNTNEKANFIKTERPEQKSENLYQTALNYVQQGRVSEAQSILNDALTTNPRNHDARQTVAALLLDNSRMKEAKDVLNDGLKVSPDHIGFRKAVARLEVELGEQSNALTTLLQGSNFAMHDAPYQAFLATMLQRQNRHAEAIEHFNAALAVDRTIPNVFVGLGISLQAMNRFEDAQIAYQNAKGNASLDQDLRSFIDFRIKEVNQRISAK